MNGTCVPPPLFGSEYCACDTGWTGLQCDEPDNDPNNSCGGVECVNGTCVTTPLLGVESCQCDTGWAGEQCDEYDPDNDGITAETITHLGFVEGDTLYKFVDGWTSHDLPYYEIIIPADIDGDGDTDWFYANKALYYDTASNYPEPLDEFECETFSEPDNLCVKWIENDIIGWAETNDQGGFYDHTIATGKLPSQLQAIDWDNDGDLDLVAGAPGYDTGTSTGIPFASKEPNIIRIFLNDNGDFSDTISITGERFHIAELNGTNQIVYASKDLNNIDDDAWGGWDSIGFAEPAMSIATYDNSGNAGPNMMSLTQIPYFYDIDGDNDLDIIFDGWSENDGSNLLPDLLKCNKCQKTFKNQKGLKIHIGRAHSKRSAPWASKKIPKSTLGP